MSGIVSLHERLKPQDLLVADRGFCSYAYLCLVRQAGLDAIFCIHQRIIVSFRQGHRCREDLPKSQRQGKPMSRYIR